MAVETALYPSQFNTNWPTAADMVSEGDDHLRLIKIVDKTTWPNVAGAVSASHIELNYLVGVTSGIQAQLNAKGAIAGQTWTGAHVYSGSIAVPTLTQGTSTTGAASTAFVQNEWSTRLPNYSTPITASSTELNYVAGVTSAIQTQINTKGAIAGQIWSGSHDFTAGSISVPTAAAGDNTTKAASTAFVQSQAFSTALPSQTGNAGAFITTDGTNASWSNTLNGSLNFGGTARRITGDFSNATLASRVAFQTNTANGNTSLHAIPNGTGAVASIQVHNGADPDNSGRGYIQVNSAQVQLAADKTGTGSYLPIGFYTSGAQSLLVDTSGGVLATRGGLGYGVGSGGTVTQATSKNTTVTLNKPSGQITLASDALAAGATVSFQLANSLLTSSDVVLLQMKSGAATRGSYQIWADSTNAAGATFVFVKNISAASLSEAIVIQFAIIKGATS